MVGMRFFAVVRGDRCQQTTDTIGQTALLRPASNVRDVAATRGRRSGEVGRTDLKRLLAVAGRRA
jgi:hypothetical protein